MSMIKNKPNQHGFTMLEVLIALFVLSVGLLGLAGLQAQSLQFNYSAYQRSQATFLAYDIIDRMRANRDEALLGSYDLTLPATPPSANCQLVALPCTTSVMADFDLSQWIADIENRLAEGDGAVALNDVNGRGQVIVTITWLDNRTLAESDPNRMETFTVSSVL